MKNDEEMLEALFNKRDEYYKKRKIRNKIVIIIFILCCSVGFINIGYRLSSSNGLNDKKEITKTEDENAGEKTIQNADEPAEE